MEIIKELFFLEVRKAELGTEMLLRFWWIYVLIFCVIYLFHNRKSK